MNAVAPTGEVKAVRFHYVLGERLTLDKMDPHGMIYARYYLI